ncbi:hypothetical protein HDA40_002784 [Hamadaea flava]|uniref:Lipoprotein n=1 Tax=Hamadaea flava TaxID=1742688 RepID=A0ABV8LGF1_9ACTN|nr:hypothetical protein [Hamadaea flava]MCP2324277.1 hypothetical protein [Hamadaea flava]
MPRTIGRLLGVALAGVTLAGAAACTHDRPSAAVPLATSVTPATSVEPSAVASPVASATSTVVVSATNSAGRKLVPACAAALTARQNAADALSPVSAVLVQSGLFHEDLAKATRDLMAAITTLHAALGAAAELAADPKLKAKITAYQVSVEQAIVAGESSDSEQAKLKAVIASPAMRDAGNAVVAACA